MNARTADLLRGSSSVRWIDPAAARTVTELHQTNIRGVVVGLLRSWQFWRALRANERHGALAYLSISVDGLSFWRDLIAWTMATGPRRRTIVHLHTGAIHLLAKTRLRRLLTRRALRTSEVWVLDRAFITDYLREHASKVAVVPNGVDCMSPQHEDDAARERPSSPFVVTYLGNLVLEKGVDDAVLLADELASDPHFNFVFAGAPYDKPTAGLVEDLARRHPHIVRCTGPVGATEKCRILAASHVLVFFSRYELEGAPLVVLEALAHGTTPIVFDHAAVASTAGPCGIVVDSVDAAALALRAMANEPHSELVRRAAIARRHHERRGSLAAYERSVTSQLAASGPVV